LIISCEHRLASAQMMLWEVSAVFWNERRALGSGHVDPPRCVNCFGNGTWGIRVTWSGWGFPAWGLFQSLPVLWQWLVNCMLNNS